nr:InlB B-repeat-containing protein [Bacillota bacterium]
ALKNIVLPETLTSIGRRAFSNCLALTAVNIPESVTTMDQEAFNNCAELTIYTTLSSVPMGWDSTWNPTGSIVRWDTALVTITFESNGGSYVNPIHSHYSASINAPVSPSKTGYVFSGWYENVDLTTIFVFTTMPEVSITLYACWMNPSEFQSTLNSIYELWGELSPDATAQSLVLLKTIYETAIEAIASATNESEAEAIYATFVEDFMGSFIRDYEKIDLTYAKSTATDLIDGSTDLVFMFFESGVWELFNPRIVLAEYYISISDATTILEVDDLLEEFIIAMGEAIGSEGPPPQALVTGFQQACVGAVSGVYAEINGTSNSNMGFQAISETFLTNLQNDINGSDDIPDIIRYVFYGIRDMFQSLGNQGTTFYQNAITEEYNNARSSIESSMLEAFDAKYQEAYELVEIMQFYETKYLVYLDYYQFVHQDS